MDNLNEVIWLLCVNDFHAELAESEGTPGCEKFVTAVKEFIQTHPNTVVLFGGDNYRGDPISEVLGGEPVTRMMKLLNAKASAIGNHEFDYGMDLIEQWQKQGNYQFLAANLMDKRTGQRPESVKASMTVDVKGINILIIGLSTVEPLATADRPPEMEHYELTDGSVAIRDIIDQALKSPEKKPDAIIGLTHFPLRYLHGTETPSGDEAMNLCREVPELDGVFTGHLHQFMALNIHGAAVAQGKSNSQGFAWLRLEFDDNRCLQSIVPGFEDIRTRQTEIIPDTEMRELYIQCKEKAMKTLGRVITHLPARIVHRGDDFEVDLEGTPLSGLATKVMCDLTGCQIALFYSGRIGRMLPKGDITLYQAYQTLFFNNGIVTMKLSGREIIRNIEIGIRTLRHEGASPIAIHGIKVVADYTKPYRHRVEKVVWGDGREFDPDASYPIAIDDFLAGNSMGFDFSKATQVDYTGLSVREGMIQSLSRGYHFAQHQEQFMTIKNKGSEFKGEKG